MGLILKYFLEINKFNLLYSLIIFLMFSNIKYFFISFGSFGTFVGFVNFNYFYGNQYYLYYNLGYTKIKLILISWLFNVSISIILYYLLKI